jgi:pimeloyl-ACP methyl ester carboxylesterase
LILFDFPHQGRARILHGPDEVPLLEQVEILDGVARALSPQAAVSVMGASWGAVIAATWAAVCPDRARAVLLGSFQTRPNARLRAIAFRVRKLAASADTAALGTLFIEGFGANLRPAAQAALCDQFRRLTPEQVRQLVSQSEALATYGHLGAVAELRRIRARTLIVNGADDPIVDADNTWEAGRLIAGSEVRLLPGVGHFLHMEDPAVMEIYAEFLDRVAAWRPEPFTTVRS